MFIEFNNYFFTYVFRAKTRQKLLFLAILGLVLSSFALLVLQSTMGGLQNNLVNRSKDVTGHAYIDLKNTDNTFYQNIKKYLKENGINGTGEYELELLLRYSTYISPVILHGIDRDDHRPSFLKGHKLDELLVPRELSIKLGLDESSQVELISPAHVDTFLEDIPRVSSQYIEGIIGTDVPEIDLFHIWTRKGIVQNIIGHVRMNRIRIYKEIDALKLEKELAQKFGSDLRLITWEKENSTLVWALKLETFMMIFLFTGMSLLVSLCITSGLLIFFSKIKTDLASFWILGSSKKELEGASGIFLILLSFCAVLIGLVLALIFLFLLDRYGVEIMPDVFVDRKIPIFITGKGLLISFTVPFSISLLFSYFSLLQFKKDNDFLSYVRTAG